MAILPGLLGALPLAPPATAQDASMACSIRNDPIEFGVYNTLSASPRLAVGRIELHCNGPVVTATTRVTLTEGQSGIAEERFMSNGTAILRYNLYADPGRTRIVGTGPDGGVALTSNVQLLRIAPGFGVRRALFRVFAAIPPGQAVPAGSYTDVIQIQVEF